MVGETTMLELGQMLLSGNASLLPAAIATANTSQLSHFGEVAAAAVMNLDVEKQGDEDPFNLLRDYKEGLSEVVAGRKGIEDVRASALSLAQLFAAAPADALRRLQKDFVMPDSVSSVSVVVNGRAMGSVSTVAALRDLVFRDLTLLYEAGVTELERNGKKPVRLWSPVPPIHYRIDLTGVATVEIELFSESDQSIYAPALEMTSTPRVSISICDSGLDKILKGVERYTLIKDGKGDVIEAEESVRNGDYKFSFKKASAIVDSIFEVLAESAAELGLRP